MHIRDSKGRFAKRKKGKGIMALIVPMILVGGLYGAHGVAVAIDSVEPEVIVVEQKVEREVPIIVKIDWTEEKIKQVYREQAEKYNVSFEQMWNTVMCENPQLIPDLQSHWVSNGVREESYGISQIHLPSWPEVTHKQAVDPQFSAEFMAEKFSEGLANRWTCWRNIYGV